MGKPSKVPVPLQTMPSPAHNIGPRLSGPEEAGANKKEWAGGIQAGLAALGSEKQWNVDFGWKECSGVEVGMLGQGEFSVEPCTCQRLMAEDVAREVIRVGVGLKEGRTYWVLEERGWSNLLLK